MAKEEEVIKVSRRNLHYILGVLNLCSVSSDDSYVHPDIDKPYLPCLCGNNSLFSENWPKEFDSTNRILENILGPKGFVAVKSTAWKKGMERRKKGSKIPTLVLSSPSDYGACIPAVLVLESFEEMLRDGKIVVVD